MGFFSRLFGICKTQPPTDDSCWSYSNGIVHVNKKKAEELHSPGQAISLEGKGLPVSVILINHTDGNVYAFKNECPHGKRKLDPDPKGQGVVECCSIGKSTFNEKGEVISGSAKHNIKRFHAEVSGDTIAIDLKH